MQSGYCEVVALCGSHTLTFAHEIGIFIHIAALVLLFQSEERLRSIS